MGALIVGSNGDGLRSLSLTPNDPNAANSNTTAIQAALNAGGTVQILGAGTYYVLGDNFNTAANPEVVIAPGVQFSFGGAVGPLVSLTNSLIRNKVNVSGASRALLIGDSMAYFTWVQATTATGVVDNGDGTATITFSGSHSFVVGDPIAVNTAPDRKFNVMDGVVTARVNSGTFTATYTLGGRTSSVTSATPTAFYPRFTNPQAWYPWLELLLGQKYALTMCAAGGADTAQALDLLSQTPKAQYDECFINIGTNDIYARGNTFAQVQTGLIKLINAARLYSANVTVLLIPPRANTSAAWSAGKRDIHLQINRWLWDYCRTLGITPVDTFRSVANALTYIDAASVEADPTANFNSSDGVHQSNLGGIAIVTDLYNGVKNRFGGGTGFQFSHAKLATGTGSFNLLTNPGFTGTGGTKTIGTGTITGNVPDSWTLENTSGSPALTTTIAARSVASNGDAYGNNLQIACVYGGAGTNIYRLINTTSIHGSVTAGQSYKLRLQVSLTSVTGLTGIELVVFGSAGGGGNPSAYALQGTAQVIAQNLSGALETPPWTAPASGLTSLLVFLRVYHSSGGSTLVVSKPEFVPVV